MTEANEAPDGFLSRWSRRKAQVARGDVSDAPAPVPASSAVAAPLAPAPAAAPLAADKPLPPPPTLDDVAQLDRGSDYRRFVAADVEPGVKNAALKKLFSDPQFNVMDGLDTYIDDYGKPDPIPASMLRLMAQSHALGLFDDEDKDKTLPAALPFAAPGGASPDGVVAAEAAASGPEHLLPAADDQDAAVRLQPLDAAGPPGDPGGAGQDPGRQR